MKKQDDMIDAVRYLTKSLETSMYAPHCTKQAWDLKEFLNKLGVKNAKSNSLIYGGVLKIESLEAMLKGVTFHHAKANILLLDPHYLEVLKKSTKK
jgi:hypothetical protein